jgi:hypothetical protein
MALWGDLDNINVNSSGLYGPPTGTASTIMVDYGTGICTGATGISSWGRTGFAATGDTIRFGIKDETGVFYGDANIISIASSESLTIGSTIGLSGADVTGVATQYTVSQVPKYTVTNPIYSEDNMYNREAPSAKTFHVGYAHTNAGIGVSIIPVKKRGRKNWEPVEVGDYVLNGSDQHKILGLGTATIESEQGFRVGLSTLYFDTTNTPGIHNNSRISIVGVTTWAPKSISAVASTYVTLGSTMASAVSIGDILLIETDDVISLASTIGTAIGTNDKVQFQRFVGGFDRYVYGVSTDGVSAASGSQYETGGGWVGVTTYIDNAHQLRVKSEILVAMSGITTGNIPVYDSEPGPFKPPA